MYRLAAAAVLMNCLFGFLLVVVRFWVDDGDGIGFVYAANRSGPLLLAAGAHCIWQSPKTLWLLSLVVGASQLGDFAVGIYLKEPIHVASPLVTSLFTLASAIPLTARILLEES